MKRATVRLYEARIEDLKAAHAAQVTELRRTADVLAEQVEYLRATGGAAQPFRKPASLALHPLEPQDVPVFSGMRHMSEEEEDIRAMFSNDLIDQSELESALRDLGINPKQP